MWLSKYHPQTQQTPKPKNVDNSISSPASPENPLTAHPSNLLLAYTPPRNSIISKCFNSCRPKHREPLSYEKTSGKVLTSLEYSKKMEEIEQLKLQKQKEKEARKIERERKRAEKAAEKQAKKKGTYLHILAVQQGIFH